MAKMITVSKAEYDMLVAAYSEDGFRIAKLEEELAAAREDIRQLLIKSSVYGACKFCKQDYDNCHNCELEAEWRGLRGD